MKKYTAPEMEIVEFDAEDVIATSGTTEQIPVCSAVSGSSK